MAGYGIEDWRKDGSWAKAHAAAKARKAVNKDPAAA